MRVALLFTLAFFLLSCNTKDGYFKAIAANDVTLQPPQKGEWLYHHKEKGQTFEEYKKAKPVRPSASCNIIYLKPIGNFTPLQQSMLHLMQEYVAIFFQQQTVLLPAVADNTIPTRLKGDDNIQLLAPYVLDSLLKGKAPNNGIALMAITAKDLYPKDDWNYVFGIASYVDRVGVSSIYRLESAHLDSANFTLCLQRIINIATHEIGHMLSMHHCTFARCIMNGSNTMSETDACPNRLCSECQRKLCWNFQYDNKKRLTQLCGFFKANNLQRDLSVLQSDLAAVE